MWNFATRERVQKLLQSEDVCGTTLLVLALDMLGPECLYWTPPALKMEMEERLGYSLPDNNLDKLLAARAIVTADDFYQRLPFFLAYANALAGDGLPGNWVVPATAAECAWAVLESALLFPPEKEEENFSEEIRAYIGRTLQEEGYLNPPSILKIATKIESNVNYDAMLPEDSTMFGVAYQDAQKRTADLEATLKENLQNLLAQIRSLPLKHGKVDALPVLQ